MTTLLSTVTIFLRFWPP